MRRLGRNLRRLPAWVKSKVRSSASYETDEYGEAIALEDVSANSKEQGHHVNGNIVSAAQTARLRSGTRVRRGGASRSEGYGKEEEEEEEEDCCSFFSCCRSDNGSDDAEMQNLKGEVEMDEHRIPVEELLRRLGDPDADYYVPIHSSGSGRRDEEGNDDEEGDKGAEEESAASFTVDVGRIHGLEQDVAEDRLMQHGRNVLTPPESESELQKFLKQITDFFSLLLWTGSVLCLVAYALQSTVDNLALALVLATVVIITGIFGYLQDRKASNLMESFKNMMPDRCTVVRGGGAEVIDAAEIVPGDVVKIKYGDKIPADVRILWATDDMAVDNSSLTGEPEPIRRTNVCTDDNPLETSNLAFFGTMCPRGQAVGLVVRTGDNTVMGRIARLATSTGTEEMPINREINHFVHIISGVAIFLGVVFFGLGFAVGTYWASNLAFMIGIIVANVPEGLLITVTVCLTLTANRMAANSVLVKNLRGVETLGSTTCICSDKTGTLTQNIMTVQNLCYDGKVFNTACGSLEENLDKSSSAFERLVRAANVCNTAKFDQRSKARGVPFQTVETLADGSTQLKVNWQCIGDATESALIKFIQGMDVDVDAVRNRYAQLVSIPFNSANKYMVSVNTIPGTKAPLVTMKGAPERVLARCDRALVNGKVVPLEGDVLARIQLMQAEGGANGLRMLGFAELECDAEAIPPNYKFQSDPPNFPVGSDPNRAKGNVKVHPNATQKLVFLGLMAIVDPPRPQVKAAVAKCKAAGIRVIMVTGDHPSTAKAIAKQVGIIWGDARRGGAEKGPATQEDYVKWNKARGLSPMRRRNENGDIWFDPRLAPAIVMPGWELDPSTSSYYEEDKKTGERHYMISPEKWDDILGHTQIVFARTSPQQKLVIVENCQRRGEIVAVTGDGVNDAPALKRADIGIAMGIAGSEVSKQAADMILMDDNFASIVAGIEEGRLIFDNLKKSIAYTLSSNIPEIAPFLFYITLQIPQALSTILILFIDLGTDMVPAISLAWENAESDIMKRPPRDAERDRLVTKKLIFHAYLQIGVLQAVAGFFTFFVVMHDYGFPAHILLGAAQFDNFGAGTLFCRNNAGSAVRFVTPAFDPATWTQEDEDGTGAASSDVSDVWTPDHFLWYDTDKRSFTGDTRMSCTFAARDVKGLASGSDPASPATASYCSAQTVDGCWDPANPETFYNAKGELYTAGLWVESFEAQADLVNLGYVPYVPWRSKNSAFWDHTWLHQDLYGGYNTFASAVPGLGRSAGVVDRLSRECRAGEGCEPAWANVDSVSTLTALVHFGYGAHARFTTHRPMVQVSTGVIPATPEDVDGSGTSCSEPMPGYPQVCDIATASSGSGGYLYYRNHYGVSESVDRSSGRSTFSIDFTGLGTAEIMDRAGLEGSAANTLALTANFTGCGDTTGVLCKQDGSLVHTQCAPACVTLPYGLFYANASFSRTSFYEVAASGNGSSPFATLDWSNVRDLACNMTHAYGDSLATVPTTTSGGRDLESQDFCLFNRRGMEVNVASRMVQREALAYAQTAYFVCIVVVQWADLLICKTRWNSIRDQGMLNFFMNFGLIFETICAVFLCYTPYLNTAIGFRPLRFLHWTPGVPYSMLVLAFDEVRKYLMRRTTVTYTNPVTGQMEKTSGWLERNTYY